MKGSVGIFVIVLATGTIIGMPSAVAEVSITECQTIDQPGSYVLANSLPGASGLLASGGCLDVTAESVTIDLAGFEIAGNGQGIGVGASTGGSERSGEVRNGTVRNFGFGVAAAIVENVRAIDNTADGIFSIGIVKNNLAVGNGQRGFVVGGIITDNHASDNGTGGILAGNGSVLTGNVARGNHGFGINSIAGNTLNSNIAIGNSDFGIRAVCPSTVIFNTATNNGNPNLLLENPGQCSAFQNSVGAF